MKRLIILRGLPGSGKTTLADFLVVQFDNCASYSADDFFMDRETGEYIFDINKLFQAHKTCQSNVEKAMSSGVENIVVHNTNTTTKELNPYFDLASKYGYVVVSLIVENRHGSTNIHSVPGETLKKMEERFNVRLI